MHARQWFWCCRTHCHNWSLTNYWIEAGTARTNDSTAQCIVAYLMGIIAQDGTTSMSCPAYKRPTKACMCAIIAAWTVVAMCFLVITSLLYLGIYTQVSICTYMTAWYNNYFFDPQRYAYLKAKCRNSIWWHSFNAHEDAALAISLERFTNLCWRNRHAPPPPCNNYMVLK